jgi:hypothetical protein
MESNDLKTEVKILQVHCGLDGRGALKTIAKAISVNRNSLSMALSGFRNGPGSIQILEQAKSYLESIEPGTLPRISYCVPVSEVSNGNKRKPEHL